MNDLLNLNFCVGNENQLEMDLWVGVPDPNQHHSDKCRLRAIDLRAALSFLNFPSRTASTVVICVSRENLELHVTAAKGECFGSARIKFQDPIKLPHPFAVVANRVTLTNAAAHLMKDATFAFTADRSELSWVQDDWDAKISTEPTDVIPWPTPLPNNDTCDGESLATGLAFANCLRPSHVSADYPYPHGSRISNGRIMGGQVTAVAEYRSPLIPKNWDVPIPYSVIANAISAFKCLRTCRAAVNAESAIFHNTSLGFAFGWNVRTANWPASLFSAFDKLVPYHSTTLDPWLISVPANLFAAVIREKPVFGYLKVNDSDDNATDVLLVTESQHDFGSTKLALGLPEKLDGLKLSKVKYRMHEVGKGVSALSRTPATLSLCDGQMLFEQSSEDGICRKILFAGEARRR